MLTSPFYPKNEKEALYSALCRFHAEWEHRSTMQVFLDFCDAVERAHEVVTALTIKAEQHDMETRLQFVQLKMLLNSALQALEYVQEDPVSVPVTRYPLSEAPAAETPTSIFSAGTILSCPECGEGLYKVIMEVSTVGLVLDEGKTLVPLNRDVPLRHTWSTLACPLCGGRLLKDGKIHTFQYGWM